MTITIEPYRLDVPQTVLNDLDRRLSRTRWPDELPGVGDEFGIGLGRVRQLARAWRESYDWRKAEAELNSHPNYRTEIDGQQIHFLHIESARPDAFPLILTHGWPGSIVEFLDLIAPLTDDFQLVIPSLPGWGLSTPVSDRGWDVDRVARAWAELMHRLGYRRYGAQGGDWGAAVSRALAAHDPDHLVAVHLNYLPTPVIDESATLSDEDRERVRATQDYLAAQPAARVFNGTRPQTPSYALADSPAGLLAWIADVLTLWAGHDFAIDRDRLLTNVMLHWLTGSLPRLHRETAGPPAGPIRQPVGIAVLPEDIVRPVRSVAERMLPIARWTEFPRGGHFAGLEVPDLLAADIRAFFTDHV